MKKSKIISKIISKINMSYEPPFEITNEILNLISSISEKVGNITTFSNLDSRPHLRKNNRIKSVHSSLRIEANPLSLDEVKGVIDGKTVIGNQKEIKEVQNAYAAYERLETIDPYDIEDLKKFHLIMTQGIVLESGVFRSGAEGVYAGNTCIFIAPPAQMVPSLMKDLFNWMKSNKNKIHPLVLSAVFHYEFVYIHPFADGNGRMARLWHTALLYNWKHIFEFIPLESSIEKYQSDYYKAIEKSHEAGKSTPFVEFVLKMTDSVLEEVSKQLQDGAEVSMYVKKLLDVMTLEVPYTAGEIMQKLGLKSKETFRKNYIDPAIKLGFVERTIPGKPTSRNQQYIKVKV